MASITIRNLPDEIRDALRVRAALNGRSMEAEARQSLVLSVMQQDLGIEGPTEVQRAAMRALQARVLHMTPPGASLVDELISERRKAAARGD